MRSRYTAFVFDLTDYLLATWHPSTRPLQLDPNPKGTQWLGLQIRQHQIQNDTQQTVEFVARSRLHGRATRLHEISQFVRQEGQWFYVDGVFKD